MSRAALTLCIVALLVLLGGGLLRERPEAVGALPMLVPFVGWVGLRLAKKH